MEICRKIKFTIIFLSFFFIFIFINLSYAQVNFKKLEEKNVPYLDFFLLKFENKLIRRSQFLRSQWLATRVQYSAVIVDMNFDKKEKKINIGLYAAMDANRYKKKRYKQKLRDCNQVRNLILYKKTGYKFFTQKRDPYLSKDEMENIFKEVFFNNLSFSDKEIEFLTNNMFINVTIFHPINKTELICSGKINDYELK